VQVTVTIHIVPVHNSCLVNDFMEQFYRSWHSVNWSRIFYLLSGLIFHNRVHKSSLRKALLGQLKSVNNTLYFSRIRVNNIVPYVCLSKMAFSLEYFSKNFVFFSILHAFCSQAYHIHFNLIALVVLVCLVNCEASHFATFYSLLSLLLAWVQILVLPLLSNAICVCLLLMAGNGFRQPFRNVVEIQPTLHKF
jgi:hypothetical protein